MGEKMFKVPEERSRLHPLATSAFVVSLLGIPLAGLITGPIAVMLAAIALSQIASNSLFRGRGMAMAAIVIGIADMILWVAIVGLMVPQMDLPVLRRGERLVFPSGNLLDNAPSPIKQALENNVFFLVKRQRWPSFLTAESFSGSGVVLGRTEREYLILTNRHVVDPSFTRSASRSPDASSSITAYFYDGTKSPAHIRWVAGGGADLALVATGERTETIPIPQLHPLPRTEIGDKVFTVGNPHDLTWSYNEGVISAIREISAGTGRLRVYQTQTPINEGNSGGGLYSVDGTLIGIVTWTKDKSQAEGISFAIAYTSFLQLLGGK
jgi:S1-C subfamily serine protease